MPSFIDRDRVEALVGEAQVVEVLEAHSCRQRVEEVMRPAPTAFRGAVPAAELARYLAEHDLDEALLTAADGRLVGAVSRHALESLVR